MHTFSSQVTRLTRAWVLARIVVAPPSSFVKCLWGVFVWGGCCSCRVCVCWGCCSLSVCVCVCVCDLLIFSHLLFTGDPPRISGPGLPLVHTTPVHTCSYEYLLFTGDPPRVAGPGLPLVPPRLQLVLRVALASGGGQGVGHALRRIVRSKHTARPGLTLNPLLYHVCGG